MMSAEDNILDRILVDVRREIAEAKQRVSYQELEAQLPDLAPCSSFSGALGGAFGLIAEIKVCSPSMGAMRVENVNQAPQAYRDSDRVKAVSLLTSQTHFGMDISDMARLKKVINKPVLRKDFFIDPYQVLEARVNGADAILLMSQHLGIEDIRSLHELASSVGLDVLLECYTREHIEQAPHDIAVLGINSRNFRASSASYEESKERSEAGDRSDFTTDLGNFENIQYVRPDAVKIAESGISPATLPHVKSLGFNAALIGTSLLMDERGVAASLADFESAVV